MTAHYLDRLFAPRAIALFGASERPESVGARVFENLLRGGFEGPLHPINPRRETVQGKPCHASLEAVGKPVDLAIVATPAATVPAIIQQCGEHGVRNAVVLSAGFGEGKGTGRDLQQRMLEEARRHNLRILGPNCLGIMRPHLGINATFSKNQAIPGNLALVSQSGALGTAILDWAEDRRVGFSALVSLGSCADLAFGDILDYLALDPQTEAILLYVEGIRSPRHFMSGLRVAARLKPVIVVKAGRHEAGSRAAVSHTGALVGGDDAFAAALRRAGVVRALTIQQLFAAAHLLARYRHVGGNRLFVVTNAGGPGVLASDRAVEVGLEIPQLGVETQRRLDALLPAQWSHNNPIDILGDATPERYARAVAACLEDEDLDGLLVMLTPQAMTDPTRAAQAVVDAAAGSGKPVLTCWMGAVQVKEARELFRTEGIPTFTNPEPSVESFAYLARYRTNQRLLRETPGPLAYTGKPDVEGARLVIQGALEARRETLSITESKALLRAFHIPVLQAVEARSANDALVAAESLGFPVALKIASPSITHKSDVGGVRLDIQSAPEVRGAFNDMVGKVREAAPDAEIAGVTVERMCRKLHGRELMVGVVRDAVFGPVISFGAGGTAVEILKDSAVALPPLNSYIAADLIGRTKISRMLGAFRNLPPARLEAIEQVLLRVSEMVCELPEIRELDINPLIADEEGAVAVDARVVVGYPGPSLQPYDHMAIHPYPAHLESRLQLTDGTSVLVRPIRPEDADLEKAFVRSLSEATKYFRFMHRLTELTQDMLVRFTQIDYDREMALIAATMEQDREVEIGVARYVVNPDQKSCEFAIVVADAWHGRGIGTHLMRSLMEVAREIGLVTIQGEVLSSNANMLGLLKGLGFQLQASPEDPTVQRVERAL